MSCCDVRARGGAVALPHLLACGCGSRNGTGGPTARGRMLRWRDGSRPPSPNAGRWGSAVPSRRPCRPRPPLIVARLSAHGSARVNDRRRLWTHHGRPFVAELRCRISGRLNVGSWGSGSRATGSRLQLVLQHLTRLADQPVAVGDAGPRGRHFVRPSCLLRALAVPGALGLATLAVESAPSCAAATTPPKPRTSKVGRPAWPGRGSRRRRAPTIIAVGSDRL